MGLVSRGRALRIVFVGMLWVVAACGDDGPECERSIECGEGLFCVGGTCTAECNPNGPGYCENGICTQQGRCAYDQPDPAAGVCAATVIEAEFGTPTVVLLVDQSGSMTTAYSGSDRWTVLRNALIHPTDGVVTQLQDKIRFGLTLYTNVEPPGSPSCPTLTVVSPTLNNRDGIAFEYEKAVPLADTPTGESIDAVVRSLTNFSEPGAKFVIVATDGEPDTCAQPNPQNPTETQDARDTSVTAARAGFDAGITLFIISVGEGQISQQHLQDMANAGVGYPVGGPRDAPFYEAADATQLRAAFDSITARVLTCELTVNGEIQQEVIDEGEISLDGDPLALDDADGWELIDDRSFRLLGQACENAKQAGTHTVTARFGCPDVLDDPELHLSGGGAVGSGSLCASATTPALALVLAAAAALWRRSRRRGRPV